MLPAPRRDFGRLAETVALLDSLEPGGRVAALDAACRQLEVLGLICRDVAPELRTAADDEPSHLSRAVELLRDGRTIHSRWEVAILLCVESFSALPGKQKTQLSEIARKVKTARKARGPA